MAKKPPARALNQFQTSASPDDLTPANRIASEIVTERLDLLPSIEHIMNAGLDDETAATALGLFRTALTVPGDPHRDPRHAVTAATGTGKRSA